MLKYLIALIVIAAGWLAWWLMQTLPLWVPITVTCLAIVVVLGVRLFARFRAASAARELENALAEQASVQAQNLQPDEQEKLERIRAEFEKAVSALKSSRLGRGRRDALYILPWYLIIGPPGVGKTIAVRNSGLHLPHIPTQDDRGVRGIGGTRNCDWWFTNEAVLLDTAGRWTTQADDHEEWMGFLGFLKKYRKRKPLNGILAVLSAVDLAEGSAEQNAEVAKEIRERIDETMAQLQMSLPVYVLFTKCDLISGFIETFGGLTKEERSVVWGFTESVDAMGEPSVRFENRFDELIRSLESFTMRRLDDDRRLEVRHKVFGFPQQLEGLKPRLVEFIGHLFEKNVYSDTPMMRGAYFASGTQGERRPFDRVLQGLAEGYGLAPLPDSEYEGETKGYFLRDLFRKVIFPDRDLALRSEGERIRQRRLYYATVASVFLLAGLLLTVPFASCVSNRALVARVEQAGKDLAVEFQKNPGVFSPDAYGPLVEEIDTLALYDEEGPPLRMGAGLYQGDDLIAPTYELFGKVFEQDVLAPIHRDETARLAEFGRKYEARPDEVPSRSEYLNSWDRLRRHLLVSRPKKDAEPVLEGALADSLAAGIASRWAANIKLPADDEAMNQASESARAYARTLAAIETLGFRRNNEVVEQARSALSRVDDVDLAIEGLIQRYDEAPHKITVQSLVGSGAPWIKGERVVRAAFTKKVWDEHIKKLFSKDSKELLGEMWVLDEYAPSDTPSDKETYRKLVRSRYLNRYVEEWDKFIRGFEVKPPTGKTSGALGMLEGLTERATPPLESLFRGIDRNVDLRGILQRQLPDIPGAEFSEIDVYKELRGFVSFGVASKPAEGEAPLPTGLDRYQEQLRYLADALRGPGGPGFSQALQTALATTKGLINDQEIGWRPAFKKILLPPILCAEGGEAFRHALVAGQAWCGAVFDRFDKTISGGYPFQANGDDVRLADFAGFYRPNDGVLWSFYAQFLSGSIPRHGDMFSLATTSCPGAGHAHRQSLLQFLSESWQISSSLFPAGSSNPQIEFEVRMWSSPTVAAQILSIGGRSIERDTGPERWVRMFWPGEDPAAGASLTVRGAGGMRRVILKEGDWGFFRLLESGRARRAAGSSTFTVTWRLETEGVDVRMDFRPLGTSPFFHPTLLGLFRGTEVMAPKEIVVTEEELCP